MSINVRGDLDPGLTGAFEGRSTSCRRSWRYLSGWLVAAGAYYILRLLLYATQDAREPPVILTDKYNLSIYTVRFPFFRIYIVNDTGLSPALPREWPTVSFNAVTANVGGVCGMSKKGPGIMNRDLASDEDLDEKNGRAAEVLVEGMAEQRDRAIGKEKGPLRVGMREWVRELMIEATTEAVYGSKNPTFEDIFLSFIAFPSAMRHKEASELVRRNYEHFTKWGVNIDGISRIPDVFWVLYPIFSDERALSDIRDELEALVHDYEEKGSSVRKIDIAGIRCSCPILLRTFQETLRYRSYLSGPRLVLEDVRLDSGSAGYLLKKGSLLMIPTTVQHNSVEAWGDDKRQDRTAYRPWGGGHTLCPGRHFASTEIMMLAALAVLRFDVVPATATAKWTEHACDRTPSGATFPAPNEDVLVELRPRDVDKGRTWRVTYSGSDAPLAF
ncbi:cytochrome P450 [Xylariaceae sp. FL0255]|nr:cytochrome P450 [Xylariaceae sp. FL0255]